jgi:hypothetical protein
MDAYPATRPFLGGESAAIGFTGPAGTKFAQTIGLALDPPAGVTLTAVAYGRDPSTFGSGLTATLPGELYANAGFPGVVLGLGLFGAVAGWVRRFALTSNASGAFVLYAAAMTTMFAVFADYFGQFYRGGAVVLGIILALLIGRARNLSVARAIAAFSFILGSAAVALIARRFVGAPPSTLLANSYSIYAVLVVIGVWLLSRVPELRTSRPQVNR